MWLSSSNTRTMDVMERLESMRRLESTSYARRDYLSPCQKQQQHEITYNTIDKAQRQQMVHLLYEIADFCHFRRETVEYAVYHVMDRYLSCICVSTTQQQQCDAPQTTADLQLIASASILIAVKVLEPVSMDVKSLADLSGGAFGSLDVLAMEKIILFALQWNVSRGPTSIAFVQHLLALLQTDWMVEKKNEDCVVAMDNVDCYEELLDALLENAQYQVELAVADYVLGAKHTLCDIALAAIWNALESHLEDSELAKYYQRRLWTYTLGVDYDTMNDANAKEAVEGQHPLWKQQQRSLAKVQLSLCQIHYHAQRHFQQESSSSSSSSEESDSDSDSDNQKPVTRGTSPIKRRLPSRNCRSASSTFTSVTSSSSSPTNDDDHESDTFGTKAHDDGDDADGAFSNSKRGEWTDTSERTLVEEEGEATRRMSSLFPSPTSVAANHLSAHGDEDASSNSGEKNTKVASEDQGISSLDDDDYYDEEEKEERKYGFGLGFLQRWLFA